jgi:hypothetical protein
VRQRIRTIIRLKQLSFGSQVKLALLLAVFAALGIFVLLLGLQLAGAPVGRPKSVPMIAFVSVILAAAVAAIQIVALGFLRLLHWQGPSLKVDGGDDLRRVFE